ncbi:DUF742 domain-containing protein [Pseudonocardia sp. N23]|uniref:DUF742 domain-containing protein n=1 Tax=Pseudonocardia sp. N23 TaxID=1987376 RepID=UPI000C0386B2|nr:DUF742 domain-containing protein [Pseudonocardia sp. N23]GAY10795.1 multi-component regulatory system-8 [Pseudonocardia sp. N23]
MAEAEPGDAGEPVVGRTGARFGGAPRRRRPARESPAQRGDEPAVESVTDVIPIAAPPAAAFPAAEPKLTVRPYVLTGGRTRSAVDLGLETLVSARPGTDAETSSPAHRAVLARCAVACSVAEVAATAGVPSGVARVLIGDLVATGAVQVHGSATAGAPDQALLARVLDGLRKL